MAEAGLRVLDPGRSCVQDAGRRGEQQYGVSVRGSSDQYSAAMACALVANDITAPLIEVTALGLAVEAVGDLLLAVTGAGCDVTVDGHSVPTWQPIPVSAGSVVRLARMRDGLRCYVAVNGQIEAPMLLGSVTPDPGLGFGWFLAAGDVVPVRTAFTHFDHPHLRHPLMRPTVPLRRFTQPAVIDVTVGPDWGQFLAPGEELQANEFTVGNESDEVGLRLAGPAPTRVEVHELRSRGVVIGAVEVTPSGEIIVLLRGRTLTAGYPVAAVATTSALSALGQVQPGDRVRFRVVTTDEAVRAARSDRAAIDSVASSVRSILASVGVMPDRL